MDILENLFKIFAATSLALLILYVITVIVIVYNATDYRTTTLKHCLCGEEYLGAWHFHMWALNILMGIMWLIIGCYYLLFLK